MINFQAVVDFIKSYDFRNIAEFIVSSNFVLIFCSSLVVIAIAVFLYFAIKTRPIKKHLKIALKKLQEMPPSENFFNEYKEFDAYISSNQILQHKWAEFKKSFIFPSPTGDNQAICNSEESAEYFNEGSIISGRVNLRFFTAFPNYLTGTGILGTFIGLVAGISLAGSGLVSENIKEIRESLQALLNGASLAFITSITGIVCSIIFSTLEKVHIHRLLRSLNTWNNELDRRIEKVTPEELAQKQLAQLERQSEYLEEFTTKVAFNIAEALDDRLNEKLVPTLNKIIESVDSMRRERGDTDKQLIREMVEKFSESVQGAAGSEIQALAKTLDSLHEALIPLLEQTKDANSEMRGAALYIADQIKTSYERSGKDFTDGVQTAVGELRSGMSQAGDALYSELKDAFDKTVERLDTVVSRLDTSIGTLGDAGQNTEQMAIQTKKLLNQFSAMAVDLNVIQDQMKSSLTALERTASAIENAGNAARLNVLQSSQALEDFKSALNEFSTVQQQLRQIWSNYADRFEAVDTSLERIFSQINDGLKAYAQATSDYMGELDRQTKKVTELFSGAVMEFGEAVEDLSGAYRR